MRMQEYLPNLYRGQLYKNATTTELGDMVDLARTNVDLPRCNYEQGYMKSILCERCGTGYVKLISNRECQLCGTKESKKWLLVGIGSTIVFFLFLMIASRIRSRANAKSLHSSLKRICITHIQLLSYIMGLNVPWPYFILFIMYFLTAVVSNSAPMAATECLLQQDGEFAGVAFNQIELFETQINDFFTVSLISLVIAPIAIVLPFNIVWWIILSPFSRIFSCGRRLRFGTCGLCCCRSCLVKCCCACCRKRFEKKDEGGYTTGQPEYRPTTMDACVSSTVLIMYMVLPSIWRICFTALQSYRVGTELRASIDLEQKWFEGGHFYLCMCAALPGLLVYAVVVPVYMWFKLRRLNRTDPRVRFTFGFLYIGYRKERWWWESVQFFKKIGVVLIVTFMDSSAFQIHTCCGLFILVLHFQHRYDPYDPQMAGVYLQYLDTSSVLILLGTMWAAVFFYFQL
jgi:hypothetical protein